MSPPPGAEWRVRLEAVRFRQVPTNGRARAGVWQAGSMAAGVRPSGGPHRALSTARVVLARAMFARQFVEFVEQFGQPVPAITISPFGSGM